VFTHPPGKNVEWGIEFSQSMLEPVRPVVVSPNRELCLPTFSHFLIVNKTSLPPPTLHKDRWGGHGKAAKGCGLFKLVANFTLLMFFGTSLFGAVPVIKSNYSYRTPIGAERSG
jgi:hypothetical protein